mgnify:CR=1 FL=1
MDDERASIRMLEEALAAMRQQVRELRAQNECLVARLGECGSSSTTTLEEDPPDHTWELVTQED